MQLSCGSIGPCLCTVYSLRLLLGGEKLVFGIVRPGGGGGNGSWGALFFMCFRLCCRNCNWILLRPCDYDVENVAFVKQPEGIYSGGAPQAMFSLSSTMYEIKRIFNGVPYIYIYIYIYIDSNMSRLKTWLRMSRIIYAG